MKKKNSYQIRSFIVLLIICVASLIGPAVLFPENALIMQILAFIIIYSVERYLVYKNLRLSFEAFENALDVLRKLLPAYIAKTCIFHLIFISLLMAKQRLRILKMPLMKFFQSKAK